MATFNSNFEAILSLISAGSTLSSTLAAGNTTGGNDLIVSAGDSLILATSTATITGFDNPAGAGGDLTLNAGDAGGAGPDAGGDVLISAGSGVGGGPAGTVTITGNTSIAGTLTSSTLLSGAASPEGAVAATPGSLYQRTSPTSLGNAWYIKITGSGNTGWAPAGPRVTETFLGSDGTGVDGNIFTLTTADTFYINTTPTPSGTTGVDVQVYWNGIRLAYGPGNGDYQFVGLNAIQILDGAGGPISPLANDRITIDYLPL